MKRFFCFAFVIALCVALCCPAFASSGEDENTSSVPEVNVYNEITVENEELGEYIGTSVYSLNPISPSESNGLKAVMLSLIGDWDSIVVEHAYESTNGYTNYVREIQLDYPWLCSCAIFLVVLFCVLRGGFAVLCKK